MEIAINTTFGGFTLSKAAIKILQTRNFGHLTDRYGNVESNNIRAHQAIIKVIKELGDEASDEGSVKIVEIPDDVKDWYIDDYDGIEHIAEGRQWRFEEN